MPVSGNIHGILAFIINNKVYSKFTPNTIITFSFQNRDKNFLRAIYIDSLEYLVAACEDGVVYILGYDFKATKQFMRTTSTMTSPDTNTPFKNEFTEDKLHEVCLTDINYLLNSPKLKSIMDSLRGGQLSDHVDRLDTEFKLDTPKSDNRVEEIAVDSGTTPNDEVIKSVSRHVFGMKCHYALMEHKGSVTSLILFPESLHPDGIMTLWFMRSKLPFPNSPRRQFACCSADWSVYVRKASIHGAEMTLMNRLLGHHGEVGAILYRSKTTLESSSREDSINGQGEWISGSYDCTIRVWPDSSNGQCRMTLSTEGPVTCLAWERTHELLIAGVGKDVKIFDLEAGHLYQSYTGHLDIIRNIIMLPEWNEYITASADGQIRVWRAWTGSRTVTDDSVGHTQSNAVNLFSNNPAAAISAAVRTFLANESKKAKEISSVVG
ncbi:Family S9 non-peptidase ue (S09 family) [Fasciola hepatica]|uniref:Family S9 non-peptidase ue (S09 family) n=1 Tax=Fasciola hepatica TaxID=6192 RepID=A0A4E0RPG0_FASHE|nr:Family S9 non-peptidase ue (S09 family) [Fasciola hepatica]